VGWAPFFFITFLTALPGIALVWRMRSAIEILSVRKTAESV
jgi:hypothetical protein